MIHRHILYVYYTYQATILLAKKWRIIIQPVARDKRPAPGSGWLINQSNKKQFQDKFQTFLNNPAHEKDTETFLEILKDSNDELWKYWVAWWPLDGQSGLELVMIKDESLYNWHLYAPDDEASYACLAPSPRVNHNFIYDTVDWFLNANANLSGHPYHSPKVYPMLLDEWKRNEEKFTRVLADYIKDNPEGFESNLRTIIGKIRGHLPEADSLAPCLIPILQAMPDNTNVTIERKAVAMTLWKEVVQYHIYRKYQNRLKELLKTLEAYPTKYLSKGWQEARHNTLIQSINTYLTQYSLEENTREIIIDRLEAYGKIKHDRKASWFKFWCPKLPCSTAKELQEEMQESHSKLWPEPLKTTYNELMKKTKRQTGARSHEPLATPLSVQ